MMLNGLFTQIVVAALAIGIAVTYVQPTFTEIGEVQSSIAEYEREIDRVSDVNQRLAALVAQADSLSVSDRRALQTYLPNSIDIVSVPRDISAMADEAGVLLRSVGYDGEVSYFSRRANQAADENPMAHAFAVQVEGTYEQIKTFLSLTERNEYPLQLGTLDIRADEENALIDAGIKLITFSFQPDSIADR